MCRNLSVIKQKIKFEAKAEQIDISLDDLLFVQGKENQIFLTTKVTCR